MSNFYNRSNLLWFPVMPKKSDKDRAQAAHGKALCLQYGHKVRYLRPETVAELAGVSLKTVYKWIAGTHPMDARTRQLLHVKALGLLPHERWHGWHLDEKGRLTASNGWGFFPDELLNFIWVKQLNGELSATVARLQVENQQLRDAIDYLQANRPAPNIYAFPAATPSRKKI